MKMHLRRGIDKLTIFCNLAVVTTEEFVRVGTNATAEDDVPDPSIVTLSDDVQTALNRDLTGMKN